MIPFASQRGGGQDLATHLQNEYDNEVAEVLDIRGAVASDLHGAFKEWEAQATALTRCEKYLYSLSINPDPAQGPLTREQYMDYIKRTEEALGLVGQPRAIVSHTKFGREHCHVVWSRIDAEAGKAVQIAFDRHKLMHVTRAFARDNGLTLPSGYDKSRQAGQLSLYELEQARQTGLTKEDHIRIVTQAWQASDNPRAFVQALAERGYLLARGKRPYVLVDLYGNSNSLAKLIDDKAVRTKDLRAYFAKDFPEESLPTIEEAERLVAAHRKLIERAASEERYADALKALKKQQAERRGGVDESRHALAERHRLMRASQQEEHRHARDALRHAHREANRAIRAERERNRPTGLADFLGKVTGVNLIRRALQRRDDARRLEVYRVERASLKARQAAEARGLEDRVRIQTLEAERQHKALAKVEKRELAAFMRDQRADARIQARGSDDHAPSLVELLDPAIRTGSDAREVAPDLLRSFGEAKTQREAGPPDLLAAFDRAASGRREKRREDESGSGYDGPRSPGDSFPTTGRDGKPRDR